jgi:ribosomal protein S18 acetylase RimI-like enzyme
MKITNKLDNKEIQEIKQLYKLCNIERIPNFDPSIYIDPSILGFYLEYKEDILIGFLSLFYVDEKEMEIVSVVHPSYRNMGYFKKLLNEAQKAIPPNLTILYQVPSNYVDKDYLKCHGYTFHHGEEELINKNASFSNNILSELADDDIEPTAKIVADSFDSKVEEEIEFLKLLKDQETSKPFILKENKTIIGFIAISNTADLKTSHVFCFCVDKNYRSKGYGGKMLSNLPSNPAGYVLRVEYNNNRAKKLYTNSGFIHLSSTEFYTKH